MTDQLENPGMKTGEEMSFNDRQIKMRQKCHGSGLEKHLHNICDQIIKSLEKVTDQGLLIGFLFNVLF